MCIEVSSSVCIEVSDENQDTIFVKWVCSIKNTDSELVPKARLVARRFEEPENDVRKESPICYKNYLIVIMAIQGQTKERDIFVRPHRETRLISFGS